MIGERGRQLSLSKASELKKRSEEKDRNSVDNLLDIASDYSVVDGKECGVNVTDQAEATYLLDAEIAATVTELALDAASTVLEGKMRYSGEY